MAFALVQTVTAGVGTGTSVSATIAATGSKNLVIVTIIVQGGLDTLLTLTDNQGNTYVITTSVNNGFRIYQCYGVQSTSGTTSITATFSPNGQYKRIQVSEFSGFGASATNANVYDNTSTGTGGPGASASASVTSFAPSASGNLVVASYTIENQGSVPGWVAGTNYTLAFDVLRVFGQVYRLSSGTSETAPASMATHPAGVKWCGRAASFKAAPALTRSYGVIIG
jgi:hypothetical protein